MLWTTSFRRMRDGHEFICEFRHKELFHLIRWLVGCRVWHSRCDLFIFVILRTKKVQEYRSLIRKHMLTSNTIYPPTPGRAILNQFHISPFSWNIFFSNPFYREFFMSSRWVFWACFHELRVMIRATAVNFHSPRSLLISLKQKSFAGEFINSQLYMSYCLKSLTSTLWFTKPIVWGSRRRIEEALFRVELLVWWKIFFVRRSN